MTETFVEEGLELVPERRLVEPGVDALFRLHPGDRPMVASGATIVAGSPLAERLRDAHVIEVPAQDPGRPGERRPLGETGEGEVLFDSNGRSRLAAGEHLEPLESPVTGIVREVRPGIGIVVRAEGSALRGVAALGDPTRGRLEIATDADGELRPRSLDVGSAGAILVVGARIDAEALTRARAMGIRGVVVATLPGKDRRDYLASEGRQRAALHRLPPFGVLVLHGSQRRPVADAEMHLLESLAGRDVSIVSNPPALVFDADGIERPDPADGTVHVHSGRFAGRTGRWAGSAGLRRFAGGTHLEAGFVRFGEGRPVAIPLADLERLV